MRRYKHFITIASLGLFFACGKKDVSSSSYVPPVTTNLTELLLDSVFYYAKQTYFWYDKLPEYDKFKPRSFNTGSATDLEKATSEIFALTRYAINPATGKSYEYYAEDTTDTKYSYIEDEDADLNGSGSSTKSYVTLLGNGNDLGFVPASGNYVNVLYNKLVYNSSPAFNSGLKRGSIISAVNGNIFSLANDADITKLNSAFNGSSITLTIADSTYDTTMTVGTARYRAKKIAKSHDVILTKTTYKSNVILKDTLITVGSHNIGYIALLNFASPDVVASNLKAAISDFKSKNITDIVVDLRYNGGGYVATSQLLANQLAPSTAIGKKMFSEVYNNLMQNGGATILKNQYDDDGSAYFDYSWKESAHTYNFSSSDNGGLGLSNVCFIVSDGTASASELLINNLKPYMNVKLIGVTTSETSNYYPAATNTYGKPVGFFGIKIQKYLLFISQFESHNSLSTAVPYSGFTCDVTDWDDYTHDFGNPKEDGMAQAINYITNGSFVSTKTLIGAKSSTLTGVSSNINTLSVTRNGSTENISVKPLPNNKAFGNIKVSKIGMIDDRHK